MAELRVGSLFSGIGGLELGLERAGMKALWQIEPDFFNRRILRLRFPSAVQYRDVRYVRGHEVAPIDVLCGGFPCQPVSLAGKRLAQDDDRWLWPHFHRLIRALEPRWVVAENVRGLLSAGIEDVLRDLAESGYDAEWDLLPASLFGAPHLRHRVFIVAYPHGQRLEAGRGPESVEAARGGPQRRSPALADPDGVGSDGRGLEQTRGGAQPQVGGRVGPRIFGRAVEDAFRQWLPEPDVGRVAHGVPSRVDRIRALGNAVVPQVAEFIGRRIVAYEERNGTA